TIVNMYSTQTQPPLRFSQLRRLTDLGEGRWRHAFYDGLGRTIQGQEDTEVRNTSNQPTRAVSVSNVVYDAAGRMIQKSTAFKAAQSPDPSVTGFGFVNPCGQVVSGVTYGQQGCAGNIYLATRESFDARGRL